MKLVRFGLPGDEKPGLVDADGIIRDLSCHVQDIDCRMLDDDCLAQLRGLDPTTLPKIDQQTRDAPCITNVGKFLCIGLNFYDHAKETGLPIPANPILFMKATSSISGANDDIIRPRTPRKLTGKLSLVWLLEAGKICE